MSITEVTRRDIIDYFIAGNITFSGNLDELEFLARIWNLSSMPSWDGRFETAYRDIYQHRINNPGDWTDHYLLCTRLDLLKCEEEIFGKFLENCVHPIVQPDKEQATGIVSFLNECLKHDGYILRETSQISGKSVYKLSRIKGGVSGSVKNLVFAANGPKPEIVLVDAVSNNIKIVKNEKFCLIYDKPILEQGLLWKDLLEWWQGKQPHPISDHKTLERGLLNRLLASLSVDSPPERLLFQTYYRHFLRDLGNNLPALIPQVYLHYDPKTVRQLAQSQRDKNLIRQRMDFLLLFSNHTRIVLEVDGQQHYSVDGKAKPALYAEMVAEDRRIRLQGYEIYRFGGAELQDNQQGKDTIIDFFNALFQQHSIKNRRIRQWIP